MPETSRPPSPPEGNLWDRQSGETAESFEAWVAYRDLGPERSTAKVADKLGKSKNICDRWSSRHSWVERALRWNGYLDSQRVQGMAKAAVASGAGWERRRQSLLARDYRMSGRLYRKAEELIATRATKSGDPAEVLTLADLRNLTAIVRDASTIAKEASALAWGVVNAALADTPRETAESEVGGQSDASAMGS